MKSRALKVCFKSNELTAAGPTAQRKVTLPGLLSRIAHLVKYFRNNRILAFSGNRPVRFRILQLRICGPARTTGEDALAYIDRATPIRIFTVKSGIYQGFNPAVALSAKLAIMVLVLILAVFPAGSARVLGMLVGFTLERFASWYMYLTAAFVLVCLVLVLSPRAGRIRLGKPGDRPEFSTISWLAMMFCSGIGVGILVFSVSEPISHFISNPEVLRGNVAAESADNVAVAFSYVFLHWGFSPWATYAVIAIALGLPCFRSDHPLTIRCALARIFGRRLEGPLGHVIDVLAILAIISGLTTTIVLGIEQITSGLSALTGSRWFADSAGDPPLTALFTALIVSVSIALGSVVSGINRGVKWIANLGLLLTFAVLGIFLAFGPSGFSLGQIAGAVARYLVNFPRLAIDTPSGAIPQVARWQGQWTIFYWAWWIAFAPFVGLFLARISKGRSLRGFILASVIAPTTLCILWFSIIGGSAIGLELHGSAGGTIKGAEHAARIYRTIDLMLPGAAGMLVKALLAFLFLVLVVVSSSAAILGIKVIGAAGSEKSESALHSLIWALFIAAISGAIMAMGGVGSIRDVMIVAALPFSAVMGLMTLSLILSIRDTLRDANAAPALAAP